MHSKLPITKNINLRKKNDFSIIYGIFTQVKKSKVSIEYLYDNFRLGCERAIIPWSETKKTSYKKEKWIKDFFFKIIFGVKSKKYIWDIFICIHIYIYIYILKFMHIIPCTLLNYSMRQFLCILEAPDERYELISVKKIT